jgi:hypothetical protein
VLHNSNSTALSNQGGFQRMLDNSDIMVGLSMEVKLWPHDMVMGNIGSK